MNIRDIMEYSASDISRAVYMAIIFAIAAVGNALLVGHVLIKLRRDLKNRQTYQFVLNIVLSDLVGRFVTKP